MSDILADSMQASLIVCQICFFAANYSPHNLRLDAISGLQHLL